MSSSSVSATGIKYPDQKQYRQKGFVQLTILGCHLSLWGVKGGTQTQMWLHDIYSQEQRMKYSSCLLP